MKKIFKLFGFIGFAAIFFLSCASDSKSVSDLQIIIGISISMVLILIAFFAMNFEIIYEPAESESDMKTENREIIHNAA